MTVFDDLFGRVGFPTLLKLHGENVVYEFGDGTTKTVKALVDRNPPVSFDPVENASLPEIVVSFHNHDRYGVPSSAVNTGRHRIQVSRRKGGKPQSLAIMVLREQSGGVCVVGLK